MKTRGMAHQLEALRAMGGREHFALLMEQGTGKTWTLLADAERMYQAGKITAMLVVAPKGVHTNWTRREIPMHLDVPAIAAAYSSGMGKRARSEVESVLRPRGIGEPDPLRILAINYDALNTSDGFEVAERFLMATRAMMVLDESSRIKNPDAARTRRVMQLRRLAHFVRIATGTPIANSPIDIFSQFEFMERGLLGTTSYRAFVSEFAEVLPPEHPMLLRLAARNPRAARAQIIARDPRTGAPRYRNLDRLARLIEPHAFRARKCECLDLPEKVYKQVFFDLSPAQRAVYEGLERELRIELEDGRIEIVSALASLVKLQQITSGFVNLDGAPQLLSEKKNPRMEALLEVVEDIDGPFIVWARFREELRQIADSLRALGLSVVEYHGGISAKDREAAVDAFQSGAARVFVGQPQSGGIGLTLTAAESVVYYSNDFNLETRLQSEDRAHRIGTRRNVVYIDIVASGTIDEPIASALQRKQSVAAAILGDCVLDFRGALPENPNGRN